MPQLAIYRAVVAFVLVTAACARLALADEPNSSPAAAGRTLRAGAASVDISPTTLPVIVNGNFFPVRAEKVNDPLHARALVLEGDAEPIALCVVDSCAIPRELCDQIKKLVQHSCGMRPERVMISATHTHSAPSLMRAHASEIDPHYPQFLVVQVATAIERAKANLAPAEVGWAVVDDHEHTHCRQWIFRPDRTKVDPFGESTVRASMHPKHEDPDCIGPEGPIDPGLSLLSVRGLDGRPIALVANYSMHYYGTPAVSADYFGRFAAHVERMIGQSGAPEFVALMSQGTSGDLMWLDYSAPRVDPGMDHYAKAVAEVAVRAYRDINYRAWAPIAMRERELHLRMRVPSENRLAWARETLAKLAGGPPKTLGDIYAGEQIFLHEHPERDVKLQALRIGGLGIAMIPCEVFGITGLKIKAQSPLETNFTIELANGEDGYIPPPEEHKLGGYTTWACRTAGLEEQAEPKIVENILQMLEEVSGRPRRRVVDEHGGYAQAVLSAKPVAYWRMNEWSGPTATSALVGGPSATYEDGVVFYLDGPQATAFSGTQKNRAAHFAGGRMTAALKTLPNDYSLELWAWNGLPDDAREVTGYLAACGAANSASAAGDCLGIGGTQGNARGKLLLHAGEKLDTAFVGKTVLAPKTWHHVVLVRAGRRATIYCDGQTEASGEVEPRNADGQLFFAGLPDGRWTLEGKLDEVAVYDRALSAAEVEAHYRAAGKLGETKTARSSAE